MGTMQEWESLGRPMGSFEAWVNAGSPMTPTADSGIKDTRDGASRAPATYEEELAFVEGGGKATGNYGIWGPMTPEQRAENTQLEVRRRRNILTNQGMEPLPADVADIVLRDSSGRIKKARSATTQNALGAAFDSKASLFGAR